ncbi:hypothetical protein KSK37_07080 [Kaistella sp. DKR-2]|uniref:sensor histidine kinase n=1 Tax=Kaistella soli TaxID=2849654 RepID=UPI001C2517CB|nr:sensor histidine kinase [Kaistella soli]MBU8882843.1 hypothetical protein [Kaistella soli]
MVKIYFAFNLFFFSSVVLGQDAFNELKHRIEEKVLSSKNREAIDLINRQSQELTADQKAELDVIKVEALNELGLEDEAFAISQNILAKPDLPASLKLRTHLQRALVFEIGMDKDNTKAELDEAQKIFNTNPELKPQNYTYFLIRKTSYYRIFDDDKTAFKIAMEAEKYADLVNDKKNGAGLNMILGFGYFNDPEKVMQHFQKAIRLYKNYKNYNGVGAMYNNISNFYVDRRNYKLAEKYIDSGVAVVPKVEIFYIIANIYQTKSQILEHRKSYAAALENYKIATEWASKTNEEQKELKVQELDLLYNFQKNKRREIELANNVKATKGWVTMLTVFIILLTIFVLLLLFFLRMISRNKRRIELQKQSISRKNVELQKNVAEKQFLVKELNHRVKNNLAVILSLVGFQREETKNVLYRYKFQQLQNRIKTIALAHNLFSYNLDNFDNSVVEIKEYSDKIFESHKAGYQKELILENYSEKLLLQVDKGLFFGLLLNELITNTLKHAVPEENQVLKITLNIQLNEEMAEMNYADNGMFFGTQDSDNTLGHFIIGEMVQQLGGRFERKNSCYHIAFPTV